MGRLRVLYTGGSGTISASCVARSVALGMDVYAVNRGTTEAKRPFPPEVTVLRGDVRDRSSLEAALTGLEFDVVVDFLTFTPEQATEAVTFFGGRTRHYVQISTASLYRKPATMLPVVESTLRHNPFSQYATLKKHAEDVFMAAFEKDGFPVTIVRPSHTYDEARPPIPGHWTLIERIVRGREIAVPGDGTSLWTLTHARDFAVGLTGLLGNTAAVGEAFHITSDDVYSWNEIYQLLATAAGVEPRLVHVPSEFLLLAAPEWHWSELVHGDLQYSMLLDNSKIRRYVPEFAPRIRFREAAADIIAWRVANPTLAQPEPDVAEILQRFVDGYHAARREFAALAPGRQP